MAGFQLDPNLMSMFLQRRRGEQTMQRDAASAEQDKRRDQLDTYKRMLLEQAKDPDANLDPISQQIMALSGLDGQNFVRIAEEVQKKATRTRKAEEAKTGLAVDRTAQMGPGGGQPVASPTGMDRSAVIQKLRTVEDIQGQRGLEAVNRGAIAERLQAGGRTPEQLGDIAVAREKATFSSSQAELDLTWLRKRGLIKPEQEGKIRYAARLRDAYGSRDTLTNVNITAQLVNETARDVRKYRDGLEMVDRALFLIEQDQDRAGFGASVRNFIDRGASRLEALGRVLGPGYEGVLTAAQSELVSVLEGGEFSESEKDIEASNRFMNIIHDEGVAELELLGLLLAFTHESTLTGGRRFSIQAVDKLFKAMHLHDPRGPKVVHRRFQVMRAMFQKKFDEGVDDMGRLNKMFRGEIGEESIFGDLGTPPDLGETKSRTKPPLRYEYGEDGELRRIH